MVKNFLENLKRKVQLSETENLQGNLRVNERSSVRRLNGGLSPQNLQGMYYLNNQRFLRNSQLNARGLNLNDNTITLSDFRRYTTN